MNDDKGEPIRKRLRLPRLGSRGPALPDGWAGQPLFILFFIPAPVPLTLPNGLRGEMIPVPGPPYFKPKIATDKFLKRIRELFPSRLGEHWDPNDVTTIIGRWVKGVRHIRKDVLHYGYIPTEHEAQDALTFSDNIIDFVKEAILLRWQKNYPRTTLLLFGIPGLDRRGLWRDEIKAMAELLMDDMNSWIASLKEWSDGIRREH